ncbi:MAG: formylglycine-generating enzyme family protein [Kiritimatiellae bacterium]|nr:formylglycine-generating enzyme family protein [Kiritimatiellia bacterium]
MKTGLLAISLVAALAAFAVPRVDQDDVSISENMNTRKVTITYRLDDEPAVITIDIQTNNTETGAWESIGGTRMANMSGDVNKLVQNGASRKTVEWRADRDWPDQDIRGGKVRAVVTAWATNAPPDWMIVDMAGQKGISYYVTEEAIPFGVSNSLYKTRYLVMRKVPAAGVEWRMGIEDNYPKSRMHQVAFTEDYYLAIYELTQGQYSNAYVAAGMNITGGAVPSDFKNDADSPMRPVERITFNEFRGDASVYDWPNSTPLHGVDPDSFLGKLRELSGVEFDLPTEAQWEYACRAGSYGRDMYYEGYSWRDSGWFDTNRTFEVGIKMKNAWGFCDMHGNIDEYCLDYWVYDPPPVDAIDPAGPDEGYEQNTKTGEIYRNRRVIRGGNWLEIKTAGVALDHASAGGRYREFPGNRYNLHGFRLWCPAIAR